ncbi:hypothetical protein K505DRAFT_391842 [Melanomma pulvis-pyrius CBS 109.77]|uniref:C2H2-type domain-containing protein n=1 Tax=Melanomma pulvis-pyrius CBS 109.77 TaxID=1314802 RepID=A0A6A6XSE0_9PLEO|nr:hypothetical protein K505DRAFT_391842 [Melanomma pulvis-pyrius CBS 109.77]
MVGPSASHQCPVCLQWFSKRAHYNQHLPCEQPQARWTCSTCNGQFDDSLALEQHQMENGHGDAYHCDKCGKSFPTSTLLGRHRQFPSPCSDALGRRGNTHTCETCNKTFASWASYNQHFLMCTPRKVSTTSLSQASTLIPPAHPRQNPAVVAQQLPTSVAPAKQPPIPKAPLVASATPDGGMYDKSPDPPHDAAPRQKGKGRCCGVGLNLTEEERGSIRRQLQAVGVLKSSLTPSTDPSKRRYQQPQRVPRVAVAPLPSVLPYAPTAQAPGVGGLEEMSEAAEICAQIMPLVLQSDVFIHNTGNITCCGIDWTRIGSNKQAAIVEKFAGLCHLPLRYQSTEYVPSPITFKNEYQSNYPVTDFKPSPEHTNSSRALRVVALSCCKIILQNSFQEAVKIAAVDVLSCRILMNHLICTDPTAPVESWNRKITGLSSFHDIEAARQDGYKVLKGWNAARAALSKFIDRETVIVGYNLRSDLDALRIVHGRAVDVAKVFENAAKGPLSKQQLSLESLCRDLPGIHLTYHPIFGRDALQNAFAVRELGLWMLKYGERLNTIAKQKTLDLQRLG